MAVAAIRAGRSAAIVAGLALLVGLASRGGAVDLAGMDRTVAPGDDFYAYANGGWLGATEIPSQLARISALTPLHDRVQTQVAAIVQKAAQSGAPAGSDLRLVGDYYAAAMDEDGIEARGLHPFGLLRTAIQSIGDRHELARYLGETLRADVDALNATSVYTDSLFGLWIAQDLDNPARYVPFLLQGGLGMPERGDYLDPSPAMAALRDRYLSHAATMLSLAGMSHPAERAQRVVELERRIALAHASRADTRDVLKGDNHWRRDDFPKLAPGLDWTVFFAAARLPVGQHDVVVWQPDAIRGIAALTRTVPLATWRDYLLVHALDRRAQWLPRAVATEHFAFYGAALGGAVEQPPRWKRALEATDRALGDAIGRLYVTHEFPAERRARVEAIVERVRSALVTRIQRSDGMAAGTRAAALAKLAGLKVGVGYPDQWRDYAGLAVLRDDAYGNAERAGLFEYLHQLAKLSQRVDRDEWVITPQTVNAVSLPALNAINLPAAILQPPVFSGGADAADDYGAIGALIGHELAHGFDDRGGRFDASGRLHDWWTAADAARFQAAKSRLAAQFDAYRGLPDVAVNGDLTAGENIADLVGLEAALAAYHDEVPEPAAGVVDGLTGDQRFFIAYAQFWRSKEREPALRQQLLADPHAPARYRAATVRNVDAWYQAFDVRPGQAMYLAPTDRVRVW